MGNNRSNNPGIINLEKSMSAFEVSRKILCRFAARLAILLSIPVSAQVQTEVPPTIPNAKPVTVEHIKVHGAALEGNLEGDAVDRDVFVFLPPSYAKDKHRHYPVVYALHGYSIGAEQWTHEIHVPRQLKEHLPGAPKK